MIARLAPTVGCGRLGASWRRLGILLGLVLAFGGFAASDSRAADRVYWSNQGADSISFANLDASAAGNLVTTGATVKGPVGIALDLASGRIYWANDGNGTISSAGLGGGGGSDLSTIGATASLPAGVALDPVVGRIYWANAGASQISYANLDGSGGGDLATAGATDNGPIGVAVDPAARRIYWANYLGNKISYANLDGSGGGDVATGAATVNGPRSVAVDATAGRIYWANHTGNKISFANLNGTGGGDLVTTGATINEPEGLAIDPGAGLIYWANANPGADKISFAHLDGSGGADVATLTATVSTPGFPVLLRAPSGTGAPLVTGGSGAGAQLSCSPGSWAPDVTASFFYRAPQRFTYSWSRDGETIAGASAGTYTASVGGQYRCAVTASNEAGGATQTSTAHAVADVAPSPGSSKLRFGAKTLVTVKLGARRIPDTGPLKVTIANGNGFTVSGRLAAKASIKLNSKSFLLGAHASRTLKLALPQVLRRRLERTGKLKVALTVKVRDPAEDTRKVKKSVTARLKPD